MAKELGRFISEQLESLPSDHPDRAFLSETLQITNAHLLKPSQEIPQSDIEPFKRTFASFSRKKDVPIAYGGVGLSTVLFGISEFKGNDDALIASVSLLVSSVTLPFVLVYARGISEQIKWKRKHSASSRSS